MVVLRKRIMIRLTQLYIECSKNSRNIGISIQKNDIPFISLHHVLKMVVTIFYGKFHHFNSLLRCSFEINNRYGNDLLGYCWLFIRFLSSKKLEKFLSVEWILCDTITMYQT